MVWDVLERPEEERTAKGEWNERAAGLGAAERDKARACFATERRVEDIVWVVEQGTRWDDWGRRGMVVVGVRELAGGAVINKR